ISIRQDVTEKRAARDELERRARQQRALAELGQRALSGADLADLMQESARVTAAVLDVDFVSVLNLGPDHQSFVLQAGWGWPEGTVGHFEIANEPSNQAGFTVRSGEPVVSDDLQGETRFRPIPILMEYGVSSSLGVQIDYGEVMFGILSVHAISRRQYSHSDIAFLQGVANVLAAAIRQRRFEM